MAEVKLGIAWYSKDEWDDWILSVPDGDLFEDSFDEWESFAEQRCQELEIQGHSVRKIPIKLQKFLEWCRTNARPPDANSRSVYICEIQRAEDSK